MRSSGILAGIFGAGCLVFLCTAMPGCSKPVPSYQAAKPMPFAVPEGFPPPTYDFNRNPLTEEGFALGKRLFHESRISAFNDVSCGSCHQQMAAFTTFDHDLGHGTNRQHTSRNVPAIFNMAWHNAFGWDGAASSLDAQVLACLTAPEKMGETPEGVAQKLSADPEYRAMYGRAFGDEAMHAERTANALAQFVVSLVSAAAPYDRIRLGMAQFTPSQSEGFSVYQEKCGGCHGGPLFTDLSYRSVGLPPDPYHEDAGRMRVTGRAEDYMKVKVPSLRNITLTAYYTHNGRFSSLTEMFAHYADSTKHGANVDPLVGDGIPLTDLEKFYLREFFQTLTDSSLVNDKRFE